MFWKEEVKINFWIDSWIDFWLAVGVLSRIDCMYCAERVRFSVEFVQVVLVRVVRQECLVLFVVLVVWLVC